MSKYLNTTINTELGKMTRKQYLDKAIGAMANFWKVKKEGVKKIRYFTGLGKNTVELNKTMFDYAMSKVDYKFNMCTGIGYR